ncbi:MAG: nucleotidyltransferase domain-containing protein [Promethearchaeota archaeon]
MLKKSLNSAKIKLFKLHYNEIIADLKKLIKVYQTRCNLKLVVLFGSLARGDYYIGSDADLLIIADQIPEDHSKRFEIFYSYNLATEIHPVIFTSEELFDQIRRCNTFIFEIFHKYKVLFKKGEILNKIVEAINREKQKRNVVRLDIGWEVKNPAT